MPCYMINKALECIHMGLLLLPQCSARIAHVSCTLNPVTVELRTSGLLYDFRVVVS